MFSSYTVRDSSLHAKSITDLKWNCDGSLLGCAGSDKNVRVHSLESSGSLKTVHTIPCSMSPQTICWHPFNPTRLAMISDDKTVEIWDVRGTSPAMKLSGVGGHLNAAWSPDGKYIAVGNKVDVLVILDVATGKQLKKFKFNYETNEFSWTAQSEYLLFASGNAEGGTVDVVRWDCGVAAGSSSSASTGAGAAPSAVLASPGPAVPSSSSSTASAGTAAATASLSLLESIPAHAANCVGLRVDSGPLGSFSRMAVGAGDCLISLWDLRDMCCVASVTHFDTAIRCMSFSCTGEFLAATAEDNNNMLICDARTGAQAASIDIKCALHALAWHPTRHTLAMAVDDKTRSGAANLKLLSFHPQGSHQ